MKMRDGKEGRDHRRFKGNIWIEKHGRNKKEKKGLGRGNQLPTTKREAIQTKPRREVEKQKLEIEKLQDNSKTKEHNRQKSEREDENDKIFLLNKIRKGNKKERKGRKEEKRRERDTIHKAEQKIVGISKVESRLPRG